MGDTSLRPRAGTDSHLLLGQVWKGVRAARSLWLGVAAVVPARLKRPLCHGRTSFILCGLRAGIHAPLRKACAMCKGAVLVETEFGLIKMNFCAAAQPLGQPEPYSLWTFRGAGPGGWGGARVRRRAASGRRFPCPT